MDSDIVVVPEAELSDHVAAAVRRRVFLKAAIAGSAIALLGCRPSVPSGRGDAGVQPARKPLPRPAQPPQAPAQTCALTEANIEGPFFKANAPRRNVIAPAEAEGTRLRLSGRVLSASCGPLAGAVLEIWHADHRGGYDQRGFAYRGTLATDQQGAFAAHTIVPGRYLNGSQYRPAHIHVKVHAAAHRSLTTQLYFPGDPFNRVDPFIRESLVARVEQGYAGALMSYDFVLAPA